MSRTPRSPGLWARRHGGVWVELIQSLTADATFNAPASRTAITDCERALYMPLDPPLFFADAGNGDQFAFVPRNRPGDVFGWDHETGSRTCIAIGLEDCLRGWLTGSLKV